MRRCAWVGRGAGVTTRISGDLHRIPHPQRATQLIDRTGRFIPGRVTVHSGCFWRRVSLPPSERFRPSSPCPPPSSLLFISWLPLYFFWDHLSILVHVGGAPLVLPRTFVALTWWWTYRIYFALYLRSCMIGMLQWRVNRLRGNASLGCYSCC